MDKLVDMIDNDNSYTRTRGLTLIAYNAKWDKDNKIDESFVGYLEEYDCIFPDIDYNIYY